MAVSLTASGLVMPASQSAAGDANTLDDYQEGTWTPANSSHDINNVYGYYTKIGQMCYKEGKCGFTSTTTSGTAWTGSPFTSVNAQFIAIGATAPQYVGYFGSTEQMVTRMSNNAATFLFYCVGNNLDWNDGYTTNSGDTLVFTVTYHCQ